MKGKKRFWICALAAAALFAALLADSNRRIVTREYTLVSGSLPESFSGFRAVQLSDIHGKDFGGALAEKTAELEPDAIFITGDMVDKNTDMETVDALLARLSTIAPLYFVSGNHEWGDGLMEQLSLLLDKHGCIWLKNDWLLLERGGESIVLAGVEDPLSSDAPSPIKLCRELRREHPEEFCLLLGHRNFWAEKYPGLDFDLIMCGHAHGGIVRLPFLGGLVGAGFELFPDWTEGMHRVGSYELIISRGLGNSGGVPRFLNNPEIVLLTLESGQ